MASREHVQIMENPYLVSDILPESVRIRKECQSRVDELGQELALFYRRREDIAKFF